MFLALALVLSCQEEPLQALMGRWSEDDPERRDDASRRIVARWKEWKDGDLAKLHSAADGRDVELAGRAKDALAKIHVRRRLGHALLEKLPDAAELVARGTPERRLTLLVRATGLWEKRELGEESLRGLAQAACESGWTLDGHAFLEHVFNRGVKAYVPLVVPYLRHSNPAFRSEAAYRIGQLGARDHSEAVARLIEDGDSSVREAAVVSLGRLRATEHYPKLVPFLKGGCDVAEVTASVLGCAEARSAAPRVAEHLSGPDEAGRLLALNVLGKMGDVDFAPRVAAFLKDSSADVRRYAVAALGGLGASDQAERILPFLADLDLFTRTEAVRALGRTGRADLVPKLVPLLKEAGNEIAWTAAQAILDLGPNDHLTAVAELLKEPSGAGLVMALHILGQVRATAYAKGARSLLEHHQPMVRAEAAKALALLDPAGCGRDLLPLLEDPFEAVRMDAAVALSRASARDLPQADRDALIKTLTEAKDSFSSNVAAAAWVAWLNASNPGREVQLQGVGKVRKDFSDTVADAMLDWLERTHEPELQKKLNREIRLERPVDSMDALLAVLDGVGVRLENAELLSLRGRVPAGVRTTPRRLLARLWDGTRPVGKAGTVRVVPLLAGLLYWDTRFSP